tara:strand:+ start:351 stop:983 length:633 start_codon:yes stop_codon:yes gene_type:complete
MRDHPPISISIDAPNEALEDELRSLLGTNAGWKIWGAPSGVSEAHPRIILILIPEARLGTLSRISHHRLLCPDSKILVVAPHASAALTRLCLALGVSGVLATQIDNAGFEMAFKAMLDGKTYVEESLFVSLVELSHRRPDIPTGSPEKVSGKDWCVLALHGMKLPPREMAKVLNVKPTSVSGKLRLLRIRLGLPSNVELRQWSQQFILGV